MKRLLLLAAAGCGSVPDAADLDAGARAGDDAAAACTRSPVFTDTVAMFHLNVQEYGYFDQAVEIIERVLALHEELCVPLDVYLTTWMVDGLDGTALLDDLITSPVVSLSYHTRPPVPYRVDFLEGGEDWYGLLANDDHDWRYGVIRGYEEHRLALDTGESDTSQVGGFLKLTQLYGRAPYVVGDAAEVPLQAVVDEVFSDLGVTFVIARPDGGSHLGDTRNGVPIKPEAVDAKVFLYTDEDAALDGDACITHDDGGDVYDCEIERCAADTEPGACTVAFKMHDNDFIAVDSWWLTVYWRHVPPWDPTRLAVELDDDAKAAMWTRYEQVVRRAAERQDEVGLVGARDWAGEL